MPPSISVIVTNYNYGRFLKRALDSVLSQSRKPNDIIVVDDGSVDNTPDVLNAYEDRVAVLRQRNAGQGAAINAGLRVARGQIISLLDADDYWAPDRLERCEAFLTEHPEYGYVHHPSWWVDVDGHAIKRRHRPTTYASGTLDLQSGFAQLFPFAPTSCITLRRTLLEAIGPIPEDIFRLRADFFLQTLAPHYSPIGVIPEALTAYRMHGANGYSGQLSAQKLNQDWALTNAFVEWIAKEIGVRVDPATNFAFARSAVWVHRTRGEFGDALAIARRYLGATGKSGGLTALLRAIFLSCMAVQPQFTSYLFNQLIARMWRAGP